MGAFPREAARRGSDASAERTPSLQGLSSKGLQAMYLELQVYFISAALGNTFCFQAPN